jgi:error-prone DNA polymerase
MASGLSMATFPEYAELHCLSNFSFLRGASHPEELVAEAAALGYRGIAITDECSVSGAVRAHLAAREHGIRLIIGAEFNLTEGEQLVLLAPDRAAYGQLSSLITRARRRSPKGSYQLAIDDLAWGIRQCLALWIPGGTEGGTDFQQLLAHGRMLRAALPNLWIALELFQDGEDTDKTVRLLGLSSQLELPLVASNNVHMHHRMRKPLQDALSAIRHNTSVGTLGRRLDANRERHLRPLARLCRIYPAELLAESAAILARCSFSLDELRYEYPQELVPPGRSPAEYLAELTWTGAANRWRAGIPDDVTRLIRKELVLIGELAYEHYFLTVHDIVHFARSHGILCQGRGSAANSAVCYCLGITEVDPARMRVLFERFVSKERHEPPDIDVDFEHERREEVIQYIYQRYGRDRAALAATLITYRPKSAIRDVGKALGLAPDLIDLLAKSLAWWDNQQELEARCAAAGVDPGAPVIQQFLALVRQILGFPRHLSQHVGGFVISRGPLSELVPVENAAMAERTVIQWDKNDLEALGLLKVDVLGLGMLTAIRKTLSHLNDFLDTHLELATIPPEDPAVYRMLQQGDSVGVFQVESRAQMSMLPRLKPACFYDLVIEVAIVRPGPIQGDMVHPYLRRRQGLEPVSYSSEAVRGVLERTLGIPIFQEQVIELAMVAAGFSAGEADQLRRAMAAWQRRGGLEHFEHKLIQGMLERGHAREFAERIFQQIQGFGEYGFPESHAASFALLVYVSAWLKCHHPAAFCCGLLNSLPMGFYSASQLIQDVSRHGVDVRPVDVQHSEWDHRLEPDARGKPALRLGLRLAKGLREAAGLRIAAARPFRDAKDLADKAGLSSGDLQYLARAGALKDLSGHRYQAHWDVSAIAPPRPLWTLADKDAPYQAGARLAGPTAGRNMLADYRYLGLTLGPHPLQLLRDHAHLRGCRRASDLTRCHHGQLVRVAGIVTGRQRPSSASGVLFVTLEDETGNSNIVVWSSVLARYRAALLQGQLLRIQGIVEREASVIHVVAGQITDETEILSALNGRPRTETPFPSRDFH